MILTTPETPSSLKRSGSARTTGEFMRYKRKASYQQKEHHNSAFI
jgi:hypothetical protein